MSKDEIIQLQKSLSQEGWYKGKIDGLWGHLTEEAVRSSKLRGILKEDPGCKFEDFENYSPLSRAQRESAFGGPFKWISSPEKGNPENIRILDNWVEANIVTVQVPQIAKVTGGKITRASVNKRIVRQFLDLWQYWEDRNLLKLVKSWDGAFVPRLIRGTTNTLSNHAYGSAFDINAEWNPMGRQSAGPDEEGTVFPLVESAAVHGFYWGGLFSRIDGMHFEVYKIL